MALVRYPEQPRSGSGRQVEVSIVRGTRFPDMVALLEKAGVIERPTWFRLYAMHRGLANRVRAGDYVLRDDMSPKTVLEALVAGVSEENVAVTIPEGRNLREVLAIIDSAGIADATELERIARDPAWLKEQGIEGETADGYLFPDTYRFRKPSEPRAVLTAMVRQHRTVYERLRQRYARSLAQKTRQLKWGDREIVILASIVEKETGAPEERGRVASVFYNRLLSSSFPSRQLETDPTIRYGCTIPLVTSKACQSWDPAGRLHAAQLEDEANPYNTYRHAGLPPGPISNPGSASLAATMAPDSTDYLFFVAKDERTHVFSKTFEEHRRWVDKYQR